METAFTPEQEARIRELIEEARRIEYDKLTDSIRLAIQTSGLLFRPAA